MNRIRDLRKQKGMTQEELGNIINVQKAAVSKYELGRAVPSTDVLSKLACHFGVTTDYLLGLSDDPNGFIKGLLGDHKKLGQSQWNPPPSYYNDPETQQRMEEMMNDPSRKRIFLASKDLKPEELGRIADLMETIAKSHRED